MKISRISLRIERTVNLGNYESVRFQLEQTADLPEAVELESKAHKQAVKELAQSTVEELEKVINYGTENLS